MPGLSPARGWSRWCDAGEILQKLVTYRVRVAVVGDVSGHVEHGRALRDLVRECNLGRDAWFVGDLDELAGRLAA